MKILFDLTATQPNASGKYHGAAKYAIAVFSELIKRDIIIECIWDSTRSIEDYILKICSNNKIRLHDKNDEPLSEILSKDFFDVYYSALPNINQIFFQKNTKYIVTIHGLRRIEMPRDRAFLKYNLALKEYVKTIIHLYFNNWWKNRIYKSYLNFFSLPNFHFVVVSNHTKNSILANFPEISSDRIKVFYSPSTISKENIPKFENHLINYPYFLLVSAGRPEKNALRALIALDELFSEREQFSNMHVIITGAQKKSFKHKFKNLDKYHFVDYVNETELNQLYKNAFCLIYPSLNEGFGYPPIEAMSFGVPVLSSPFTSINEICSYAALYFNPFEIQEIKARIIEITLNKNVHELYSQKAIQRFKEIDQKQQKDLNKLVDYIISI